jgi:transposase
VARDRAALAKPCATGRPREWSMREIVNGIFYVTRAGCPWRLRGTRQSVTSGAFHLD